MSDRNTSYADQTGHAATALKRILKAAPQDLWLETIRRATGTAHDDLVHWMLNQPACDFAVAVHAFYRSDPAHHLDHPRPLPPRPDASQIFAQVLRNWDTGFYRTHRLEVGSEDAGPRAIRRLNQKLLAWPRGALPFTIPSAFLAPEGGMPIDLPRHLSPDDAAHLWPIYKALGLRIHPVAPGLRRHVARATGLLNKVPFRSRRL